MTNDHQIFHDQLAEYLAGGLTSAERTAVEAHLITCETCTNALNELKQLESDMTALFGPTQPDAQFESRLIEGLNLRSRLSIHPLVRRASVAVAASIILGGFGYIANQKINSGSMSVVEFATKQNAANVELDKLVAGANAIALGHMESESTMPATQPTIAGFTLPSSNAEKWDFCGGANTKLNWAYFDGKSDAANGWYAGKAVDRGRAPDFNLSPNHPSNYGLSARKISTPVTLGITVKQLDELSRAAVKPSDPSLEQKSSEAPVVLSERERSAEIRKSDPVGNLVRRTRQLTTDGKYNEALGVVDQILVLDKKNDYATGVRPLIVDRKQFKESRAYREEFDRALSDQLKDNQERDIPYADILRFPERWPDLSASKGSADEARKQDSEAQASLDKKLPELKFEGTPLADSVDFLRDVSGSNIFVNWKALESAGIDKNLAVNLKLKDAKSSEAIQTLLNQIGGGKLGYSLADGMITISTKEDLARDAQAQAGVENNGAGGKAPQAQVETAQSKIIRNGEVEFEVDSFDSAAATVAKIVNEESGYIGTTNSEKLPNGKVRGTLVIRVKPDRLDTLVLKLRGLGELKKQNLTANDVTKQYYDIASELRAAHAMQERLIEIIKTGNAQVKDLLNVEKELATWRGKIEKLEGEIRYYDSLVSLSTLTISLQERDIRTASAIKETEQADAGIEVTDVETARTSAIKAVGEAKGRIIEAELKKLDAGQFAAKVVADVPSDGAGAVIDRLKQIGKVARLEITRKQTTPDNTAPLPGAKVEKGDTRIIASFYNLANIAPRQTVTMQLACDNVAKTYADVLSQIEKAGGRVVTSNLQQPQPDETSGTIQFELPTSVADANLMQIQQAGTSLQLTVSENPDTANVTAAKRGFNLSLIAADAIPARQGVNISAEVNDVIPSTASIQTVAESLGGKIVDTNQSTTSNNGSRGTLRIELPSAKLPELLSKIESTTKVRSQQSRVRSEIPNGPTARAQVELNLATPETLVASDSGFGASLRKGFATSAAGLLWSLQLIVIGLCLVGPWILLLWGGIKFWKRKRVTSAV